MSNVLRIPQPTVSDTQAAVLLAAGNDCRTVPGMIRALRIRIGNPDLVATLDCIEAIYDAEAQEHWEASAELAKFAKDLCADHCIPV